MEKLFSFRYMRWLIASLIIIVNLCLLVLTTQMVNRRGPDDYATINVSGQAELSAVPDIATFNFTVKAEANGVAVAQAESTESTNAILEYLKQAGVATRDIKTTNYNIFPRYSYTECPIQVEIKPGQLLLPCRRERKIDGYTVSQRVTVKIRQTDKAGQLIGGVGERGATNLSGLQFTIDDRDGLEEKARLTAIADAKAEAKALAKELGVRLGDIVNFREDGMPYEKRVLFEDMSDSVMAVSNNSRATTPEIAVGENTIRANVTITYRLK